MDNINPKELLVAALKKEPRLRYFGIDTGPTFAECNEPATTWLAQIELAAKWLLRQKWANHFRDKVGSYGSKHRAEEWAETYISNGSLIAAAIGLGMDYRRIDDTPNVWLTLHRSRRSTDG